MKNHLPAALLLTTLALPGAAAAQSMEDKWQFQAIVYAYLPDLSGNTAFPPRSGGSSINVDIGTILDNLNFTFMGSFEARKGRFGFFTDIIYLDVSGSSSATRDFTIGGGAVPGGVNSNFDLKLKGGLWTVAGEYQLLSDASNVTYVVAGARLLDLKQELNYNISADVGPFVGPGRSGNSDVNSSYWDGIVGVKGRANFGDRGQWFVPYYADVGTGQSDLTWQVFGGVGYQYSWGSVLAGYRYISYDFKSNAKVEDLAFSGPMIGVAFNW